jgi:hypothetical protein
MLLNPLTFSFLLCITNPFIPSPYFSWSTKEQYCSIDLILHLLWTYSELTLKLCFTKMASKSNLIYSTSPSVSYIFFHQQSYISCPIVILYSPLFIYYLYIFYLYYLHVYNSAVNEADHPCHQMSTAAMSACHICVGFNLCAINDFIIIIIIYYFKDLVFYTGCCWSLVKY